MTASDPIHPPSRPNVDPENVRRLVSLLVDAIDDGADHPTLINLVLDAENPDGFQLGMLDPPNDPYSSLVGFTAPANWFGIGMMTGGWAYPPDVAEAVDVARGQYLPVRPSQHPRRLRVRTAYLCTRTGQAYGRTVVADGRELDEPPSSGRMVDAFRRTLQLPTDPPPADAAELFTLRWLVNMIGVASEEERTLPWDEAASLHDAVSLLELQPHDLDRAAAALHRVATWRELREAAAEGRGIPTGVAPDDAAWMDDGMFARELLGRYPSVALLLDDLSKAVSASTARRVRQQIRGWGIDTAPWAA